MPFLIRNIKPNKQAVEVRNDGTSYVLAYSEQVVLDIRNITSEMFLQSMRGEITSLFVGRMPIEKQEVTEPLVEEVIEATKVTAKKTKSEVSE